MPAAREPQASVATRDRDAREAHAARARAGAARALLAGLTAALVACAQPPGTQWVAVEDGRFAMGTLLDLWLVVRPEEAERAQNALAVAFAHVASLESVASRFEATSDVSRLNASAGAEPIEIDARLHAMLARAEAGRLATAGAFDVRVGPLVELWIRAVERGRLPSSPELAAARGLVAAPLHLLPGSRAGLSEPGMSVDVGGIAKGFALDRIAEELRARGFARGLLSFGESSVWALGAPADAPAWRLLVRDDAGEPIAALELVDRALSVSSSLSSASEIEGRRYGHVVDPRSGQAQGAGRQAIAVAGDATGAEILSTALLILSEQEGREAAHALAAEVRVSDEQGRSWETRGFRRLTRFRLLPRGP
jgi:thiamine biosynthesis lipoprotein